MRGGRVAGASWPIVGIGGHGAAVIREDTHYLLLLSHQVFAAGRAHRGLLAHGRHLNLLPTATCWHVPRMLWTEGVSFMRCLLPQVRHARRLQKAILDSRRAAWPIPERVVASLQFDQLLGALHLHFHVARLGIGQVALAIVIARERVARVLVLKL